MDRETWDRFGGRFQGLGAEIQLLQQEMKSNLVGTILRRDFRSEIVPSLLLLRILSESLLEFKGDLRDAVKPRECVDDERPEIEAVGEAREGPLEKRAGCGSKLRTNQSGMHERSQVVSFMRRCGRGDV